MTNYGSEQLERAARIESTLTTTLAGAKLVCFCAEKIGGKNVKKAIIKGFRKSTVLRKPTIPELLLGTALVAVTADDLILRRDIKNVRADNARLETKINRVEKENNELRDSVREIEDTFCKNIEGLKFKIECIESDNKKLIHDCNVKDSKIESLGRENHNLENRLKAYEEKHTREENK